MKLIDSPYSLSLTQDRRHDRRRKVDSVIYVTIEPDNGGVLLDLSEGGMCISVANPLPKSSRIRFSLALGEEQLIEGVGRVSWLSESGRSAGVRFLFFPDESRRRIREWLERMGTPAKRVNPKRAIAAEKPGSPSQAPAQSSTRTPAEAPRTPDAEEERPAPQTPLFFLPKRQEPDDISPDQLSSQEETYSWHEGNAKENDGETVVAYRSAIVSTAEPDEEEDEEDQQSNKILIVATICFALLALGVAAVVAYPNRFSQLRQFAASLTAPPEAAPDTPAEAPVSRRGRRREAMPRLSTPSGPLRGSHPVRDIATFEAPRQSETVLATEMTDPSRQRWLATASGRRLAAEDERHSTPDAAAAPAAQDSLPGNASVAVAAEPPSQEPVPSQPPPQMGRLRVDGGLLEEGSVTPTYAPLNLNGQTLASKPIVVEALIDRDGRVKHVRLVSSPASSLAQAIVDAVKLWRYRPLYRNGEPIQFITRITVDFEGSAPKQ